MLVRITGKVQGVSFRVWTRIEAEKLGLNGWVRNEDDGSVRALIVGSDAAVAAMLKRLWEGPRGAAVSGNDLVGWRPAPSLESVTRSLFQPLTIVWLLVGLAILVTSLATVSHRRRGIRHPYAERVPLASFTSGVVSRDSLPH